MELADMGLLGELVRAQREQDLPVGGEVAAERLG